MKDYENILKEYIIKNLKDQQLEDVLKKQYMTSFISTDLSPNEWFTYYELNYNEKLEPQIAKYLSKGVSKQELIKSAARGYKTKVRKIIKQVTSKAGKLLYE